MTLCLFCGKTGHMAKEFPKAQAMASQARVAITELLVSLVKVEVKKD